MRDPGKRARKGAFALLAALAAVWMPACDKAGRTSADVQIDARGTWRTDGSYVVEGALDVVARADGADSLDARSITLHGWTAEGFGIELTGELTPNPQTLDDGDVRTFSIPFVAVSRPSQGGPPGVCPFVVLFEAAYELVDSDGGVIEGTASGVVESTCETCPQASNELTAVDDLGLAPDWESLLVGNGLFEIARMVAAPDGTVWMVGGAAGGIAVTHVTEGHASAFTILASKPMLAVGEGPGVVVASAEGEGLRVRRYTEDGTVLWEHLVSHYFEYPAAVAVLDGRVVVDASPTNSLEIDGEGRLDGGAWLVAFDEMTGDLDSITAAPFDITAMAAASDGSLVVTGTAEGDPSAGKLAVLEPDFTVRWIADPGNPPSNASVAASAVTGDVFLYDGGALALSAFSADGQSRWRADAPPFASSVAPLSDGGVLVGGTEVALRLTSLGEIEKQPPLELINALPFCQAHETFGFASFDDVPTFAAGRIDPARGSTFAAVRVGRFEAAD